MFLFLLLALPVFISADDSVCPLTMSQKLLSRGRRYNTYLATILNPSSSKVSNVIFSTSTTLKSIDDVESLDGGYQMDGQTTLNAAETFAFTYQVSIGQTVLWTFTCSNSVNPTSIPTASPPTSAPKATTAPQVIVGDALATGGKKCPAGTWWRPSPATTWQWQLSGTVDTSIDVQMYDIDMFDNSKSVIDKLHADGRVVICYFSTQYEDWRPDASSWTASVLGKNLDDWAGEKYVDIRSSVVRSIITSRLDYAVNKGCDGVEPDNVDGYQADTGFPLTAADQLNFNQFIALEAHKRGLSVGLKNDGDQSLALQPFFDWALNEQCAQYKECNAFNTFISNSKAVFNCEYSGKGATTCPTQNALSFSSLIKSLDLTASINAQCCTFAAGGCARASYTCISS